MFEEVIMIRHEIVWYLFGLE